MNSYVLDELNSVNIQKFVTIFRMFKKANFPGNPNFVE